MTTEKMQPAPAPLVKKLLPKIQRLASYHQHRVEGIEHVPEEGPVLFVASHGLVTYDIALLALRVYEARGIMMQGLADRINFRFPVWRDFSKGIGWIEASHESATRALQEEKRFLMVAPGGMREALLPATDKYRLDWADRKGFVKLAIRTRTPMLLCVCPAADDMFHVVGNPLTDWIYEKLRAPAPLAFGRWGLPIPQPVPLTHYLSQLIVPPNVAESDTAVFNEAVDTLHAEVCKRAQAMIDARAAEMPLNGLAAA